MSEVYKKIAEHLPNMSRSQEKIARYILANQNQTPFLTVEKLAKLSDVSIATVTRFVLFLGYKGYPEFIRDAQESMKQQIDKTERIKIKGCYDEDRYIYDIFEEDVNNIKITVENIKLMEMKKCVRIISNAKRIYLIARRNSTPLALFLKYYLNLMFNNVTFIESIEQMPKRISSKKGNDVLIGISFEKYAKNTVEIFSHLKEKGMTTIAITDNMLSPLVSYSDITLTAITKGEDEIDSFAAPISLINTLVKLLEKEKKDCYIKNVHFIEETARKLDF